MADWVKIRTEYVTTEASYRDLVAKYGVSTVQLARHGKDEKWVEQREQFQHKTITKTLEKVSEKTARQTAKVSTLADKLLCKLEQAIDELDLKITTQR
jgi:uncharacterized protein YjcR